MINFASQRGACESLAGGTKFLFDHTTAASSYATFSAALAGFAVTALIVAVSNPESRNKHTKAFALLASAIAPLFLATLNFAEVGGESDCARQSLETMLAGLNAGRRGRPRLPRNQPTHGHCRHRRC
jgi:hypothetical protein